MNECQVMTPKLPFRMFVARAETGTLTTFPMPASSIELKDAN